MTNQPTPGPDSDEWNGMTPRDRGLTVPMVDDVFELLANWHRRAVCRYFVTTGCSSADVETLVEAVAQRGMGHDEAVDTGETAVREALVEEHLPRLDDAGVIDFDERSGAVRYWGQPTLEKWAEHAAEVRRR